MAIRLFRSKKQSDCAAVIVAAGSSTRVGFDKIFHEIGHSSVLARTVSAFQSSEEIGEIVVVTASESLEKAAEICSAFDKVSAVICGGATRLESSFLGVNAVSKKMNYIAVHDGARPLVDTALIARTVEGAKKARCCVPVVPSTDSLKRIDAVGYILSSEDRASVLRVQTPQVFESDIIKCALTYAYQKELNLTDDCAAVERLGIKIKTVEGSSENIKITHAFDFNTAYDILKARGELW